LQHLSNADISCVLKKLAKHHAVYITEGYPVTLEGSPNPDKPSGSGVRWDWRTGRGPGIELDLPPFSLRADEVCRVAAIGRLGAVAQITTTTSISPFLRVTSMPTLFS
jgi:hypothetical protein